MKVRARLLPWLAAAAAACGGAPESPAAGRVRLIVAPLVSCDAVPPGLQAQLWISSVIEPCDLVVDPDGSVSGRCSRVPALIDRSATLDYFVWNELAAPPTGVESPYRLLLAQAVHKVRLADVRADTVELVFEEDDFLAAASCRDMRLVNTQTDRGGERVDHFSPGASPCDVDDDGATNLEELCATPPGDPFAT